MEYICQRSANVGLNATTVLSGDIVLNGDVEYRFKFKYYIKKSQVNLAVLVSWLLIKIMKVQY